MLEWREVGEFPGWSVSEHGHIQNDQSGRVMRVRQNRQGIVMVGLMRGGKQHTRSVARIVAQAFVDPEHAAFDTVIYLNGDHTDCRSTNLRWRTRPFALQYHKMFDDHPVNAGVYIPELGERYFSLREACTTYGMIEQMAYRGMMSGEPVFPYGWILEPT